MFPSTDIGPCEVWAGTSVAAAVKAFDTKGGLNLTFVEEYVKSTMDKTGNWARRKVVTGGESKATGAAGEATIAQLATLSGQAADAGGTRLALKARAGTDLRASAKVYIYKPIIDGVVSTDDADWFYHPAGTMEVNWDVPFNVDGQRVYGFVIEGHPVTADEIASGGRLAGEGFAEKDVLVLGD